MTDLERLSLDEVQALAEAVLVRHGLSHVHSEAVAASMTAGERDECAAHGIYRLLVCVETMKAGKVALEAEPVLTDLAPSLVRADAQRAFAQLSFLRAKPLLIEKARQTGVAALAINNCVHFAALWPEVEAIAGEGLVAFAFTPSHAWVAPAGGTRPLFGTNPMAFGWPRPVGPPFVFDFATSAVARGEIELHRRQGRPIPEGWAMDSDGRPTTDPNKALAGAMLTFGGHKGSALAVMVELIAGPLIGDLTSRESVEADAGAKLCPLGGELILAIDPTRFLGASAGEHLARAERLFEEIGIQGARLPSERRYRARARSVAEGVKVPATLLAEIRTLLA